MHNTGHQVRFPGQAARVAGKLHRHGVRGDRGGPAERRQDQIDEQAERPEAADELGNVEVLWKGMNDETDIAGQISLVESFINQNVDAIVIAAATNTLVKGAMVWFLGNPRLRRIVGPVVVATVAVTLGRAFAGRRAAQ